MERLSQGAKGAARIVASCLILFCCLLFSFALRAQPTVLFQTVEPTFSPEITFDTNAASFKWIWADSSTNGDYPVAANTSASPGLQTLTFSSVAALTSINLGFDAGDSGWSNNFSMRDEQGVSAVIFSAPLTN